MRAKNLEETQKIAADFIQTLSASTDKATVVGLYGDLGAGKTSFTQGVAMALGITDHVVSPTFVIEKIYPLPHAHNGFTHMIHIDAYRLDDPNELSSLGWNNITADPHNLILIEWPERVAEIMPPHIQITFASFGEEGREIEMVV